MYKKLYLVFILLFFVWTPAFCYIDPGTGSMLLYAFVGVSAAFIYAVKGYFYKLKGYITGKGANISTDLRDKDTVFYSEGSKYWYLFKPVLDEMDVLGKKCVYLTSSEDDPGFKAEYENIEIKYIGEGIKAAVFLNNLKTDLVVVTTPQLDVLTIRRSKWVKHYSYIFHAPTDIGIYGKYAFDCFDSILLVGKHQIGPLRDFEKMRGTPEKTFFETGCTYYDILLKTTDTEKYKNERPVVLVAPTWNKNSLLTRFGFDFIKPLLSGSYKVILRPHPQMYISQKELIRDIKRKSERYPDLEWDENPTGEKSMAESDIMISDLSGIIFDYSFIYKKPVISVDAPVIDTGLELEDFKNPEELWELCIRESLGALLKEKDIADISVTVDKTLSKFSPENIDSIIEKYIYNFGNAGKTAAEQLISIKEGL